METTKNPVQLSFEGAISIFIAIFAWVAPELGWEQRAILVLIACALAIHIANRLDTSLVRKIGISASANVLLVAVTWRHIWESFHADFPFVTGEAALSRIIIACVVCTAACCAYLFLMRPQYRRRKVIPVQLIAFGLSVAALGVLTATIGAIWQFQRNWNFSAQIPELTGALPAPPSVPPISTQPAPLQLPGPSHVEPTAQTLNAEEIATRTAIWDSVINVNIRDLSSTLKDLQDLALSWQDQVRTFEGRQNLNNSIYTAVGAYNKASSNLETLRNEYPAYRDILDDLHQPHRDELNKAAGDFSQSIREVPKDAPQNFEIQIRPFAGAFVRELDKTRLWLNNLINTAGARRQALREVK